ncbi:TonB-dependent receptor [Dysgonomonas sp. Marseille-P4677]|uniref:TonB-dependent receptor n=1 Tax=Dysgonomonas sp. Marseille-P4677 TaxID=2364790 RepID=UPI001913E4F6|nr:TonB-dependent receptor [Dysgonomonas sp. Marseille-P4677]MBK5719297.1 TonB-dependent receptor [Dysgonomonas sp. Marseille-P4677]
MKRYIPLLLFLCIFFQLSAQAQTVNIKGAIFDDATKDGIELASIRILNETDSTYITGAVTNESGKFSVGVKPGKYILHISFLGYLEQFVNVNTHDKTSIGNIYLKEDGIMLAEATVEAKAPEIIIKGDTAEYNASAYKVQESAVLGDLIKRLPGAEIDSEGKITVNGKDISKILVDGKDFFSKDPKTASENLPARMVEKLQVLDQKSDMALLTGFDDGEEQTVINLVVKPGMKEGVMGSVSGGYGNKDRYEGNGFVNIARNDNRLSALGNFNNNNNAGGGGGGRGWGRNRGLTETAMGGVNIAMEPSEKFKYDGDVQYRGTDNDVETMSNITYTSSDMVENKTSFQNNNNKNMNGRFKFEWQPDSLTNIIFRPNVSYSKNNQFSFGKSERTSVSNESDNFLSDSKSTSAGNTLGLDGNLLINRKLNSKGRSISVELSGGLSDGDTDGITYSEIDYYNKAEEPKIQDQIYNQKNNSYNWRTRLSYLEPIGRNNFLELAYNIRNTHSETDKKTYEQDASKDYTVIAEDYTRITKNDFLNQNISLNFQARRQKYNYTVGVGLEPSRSQTSVVQPNMKENKDRARNFINFAPRVELNYLWDKRHNLRIRYNGQTDQASTDQLYDGIITQSATDTTRGNPNLKPSFEHRLNIRYQKYMAEKASSIMSFADIRYTTNAIASITRIGEGNSRNTTYENIDGNMTGRLMFMYNTPLRNKRFSINTRTFANYSRDNTFITDRNGGDPQKNTANTYGINEGLGLKFNSDKFQFNIRGSISYENTRNSLSSNLNESLKNQEIYNYGGGGDFSWYLPYNFVLESDLNYSSNSGYSGGYQENSWIWNASLAKEFNIKIKKDAGTTNLPATLRFKIYDILQDQSNISRSSNANNITYSTYNTISSYFIVGLTIRFQSFKGGAKSSDMEYDGGRRYGPPGGGRGGRGGGPMF